MIRVRLDSVTPPPLNVLDISCSWEQPQYFPVQSTDPFKVNLEIEVDNDGNAYEHVKAILSKLSELPNCYVEPIEP